MLRTQKGKLFLPICIPLSKTCLPIPSSSGFKAQQVTRYSRSPSYILSNKYFKECTGKDPWSSRIIKTYPSLAWSLRYRSDVEGINSTKPSNNNLTSIRWAYPTMKTTWTLGHSTTGMSMVTKVQVLTQRWLYYMRGVLGGRKGVNYSRFGNAKQTSKLGETYLLFGFHPPHPRRVAHRRIG